MTDEIRHERRTTSCSFAPAIRLARSWPKPSSIALGKANSAPSRPEASRRAGSPLHARSAAQAELRRQRHALKELEGVLPARTRRKLDFVFTVCDNAAQETCPVWPGQPMTAHWGVPDPAAATGNEAEVRLAFADAFRMLTNRIIHLRQPAAPLTRSSSRCNSTSTRSARRKDAGGTPASAA